jgi:hypothetical protein
VILGVADGRRGVGDLGGMVGIGGGDCLMGWMTF